jgi:hypothetical protein
MRVWEYGSMRVILVFPDSEDVVAVKGYVGVAAAHVVVAAYAAVVAYVVVVAYAAAVVAYVVVAYAAVALEGYVVAEAAAYAAVADKYEVVDLHVVAGDWCAALQPGLVLPQGVAEDLPADELLNPIRMQAHCYVVVIHD